MKKRLTIFGLSLFILLFGMSVVSANSGVASLYVQAGNSATASPVEGLGNYGHLAVQAHGSGPVYVTIQEVCGTSSSLYYELTVNSGISADFIILNAGCTYTLTLKNDSPSHAASAVLRNEPL
ncbi:hypothetical protein I6N90_20975 [Paenibacillus sp. GSMTC-2017]|uniref:hypothetical protein n=1 Tax=Paenibacillus sp. GSMTC-2017 TaxID=2794350 RepID=UPI0018D68749|nr:hypothetical protein [Paenibacillus sp. GSMTC-2017]MBH5320267.1 hypothetical protein [Paenibacillus sp. GSMTC-2017]